MHIYEPDNLYTYRELLRGKEAVSQLIFERKRSALSVSLANSFLGAKPLGGSGCRSLVPSWPDGATVLKHRDTCLRLGLVTALKHRVRRFPTLRATTQRVLKK